MQIAPATRAPGFHPHPPSGYLPAHPPPLYVESHAPAPTTRRPGLVRRPPPAPLGAPFRPPQVLGGVINIDHLPPPAGGATAKSSSISVIKGPLLTPPFEKLRKRAKLARKNMLQKKLTRKTGMLMLILISSRNSDI